MDLQAQRQQLEAKIIAKAWADASFKQALLSNPKNALQDFLKAEGYNFGGALDALDVEVVEETPQKMVLVLPQNPDDVELPDEILDTISGGCSSGGVGNCA